MKLTIFGATGAVGGECLTQALSAGHEVTVLVRTASKLPAELRENIHVIEGDALNINDVEKALPIGTQCILFAIGVDKHSPRNLCTDVTRHILELMPKQGVEKLVWCGGGSNLVEEDQLTFGARFVQLFSTVFLSLRHSDKVNQYALLKEHADINWAGVRPLQIVQGPQTGNYRLGFNPFSGLSKISFADVAHAMLGLLDNDNWRGKAPILQY